MANKKPGVMIYFDPMHKEVRDLDDHRVAWLFRAIMDYADPETNIPPDFEDDEVLRHVWNFVESAVNRDANVYNRKVGNKYSAFCRYSKENGYDPPISREEWDAAGQPTFKQWYAYQPNPPGHANASNAYEQIQTDANASNAYTRMRTYTPQDNAEKRSSDTASAPALASNPSSSSVGASESNGCERSAPGTSAPGGGGGRFVPPTLDEVRDYFREKQLIADPEYFFKYYSGCGWRGVTDWQSKAQAWDIKDRAAAERSGKPLPQSQAEKAAILNKYVKELHESRKYEVDPEETV